MTRTALYRHYDADGALLYVGISANPIRRLYKHKCRTDWAAKVCDTAVRWFDSKKDALSAERKAIRSERPQFNTTGPKRDTSVPLDTIAGRVIMACGGVDVAAKITGRTESVVYRWTYPKSRGGTGGSIPQGAQVKILDAASRGEVDISASDFFSSTPEAPHDQ